MNLLFIHQNFPGQFKHLAPHMAAQGHRVIAMTMQAKAPSSWRGVELIRYAANRGSTPNIHPWVTDFETKTIRGEACFRAALKLRDEGGLRPDVIVAHPGWGESLFVKEVWPKARLGIYCEFHYHSAGADTGFDPEFDRREAGDACRLQIKNVNNLLHFQQAEAGISPTEWQASTFPDPFRQRISVIHDGIDTEAIKPNPAVTLSLDLGGGRVLRLSREDEVITFVNRNLEPYRGYHTFMRSLPSLLRQRPRARVLIVGGSDVSYGARPPKGDTWKDIFVREVRPQIGDDDWGRVHFVGNLPYGHFVSLLQLSTVHVYLTYPFVLSWSLLEAMSAGCAIVASRTAPLREAIVDGHTGLLVDFFDPAGLADRVAALAADEGWRRRLGGAARDHAVAHYDLRTHCLPRQGQWIEALAAGASGRV